MNQRTDRAAGPYHVGPDGRRREGGLLLSASAPSESPRQPQRFLMADRPKRPPVPTPAPDAPAVRAVSRPWARRMKWAVRLLVGVPLALGLLVWWLARSPLVEWIVADKIKQLSGCTLQSRGARIGPDGRLVVDEMVLILPGISGEAARVLSAERAVVELDWSGVLSGVVTPTSLRLQRPTFVLSLSTDGSRPNVNAISPMTSGTPGGVLSLPRIDISEGTIVLAEDDPATGRFTKLKSLPVAGTFMPIDPKRPRYAIRLQELRHRGMLLDGRMDLDTDALRLRLYNVAFDAWPPESVPLAAREIWSRLNIQGSISSATMEYDPAEGPRAQLLLDDVSMNVLIPDQREAARGARDLALRTVSGEIRFSMAGLDADLTGTITGQTGKSRVRLRTQGLSLDSALTCEIVGRRFVVTKNPDFLPYIPPTAAEYFQFFSGPTGEIDARVVISRGPPENGVAAPFQVTGGRLALTGGSAAFHLFPYPFTDMAGFVEFDDRSIRIVNMTGRGPSGASLTASGVISPLTDDAMVDIRLHVTDVPVDDYLLKSMPDDREQVVEKIFSDVEYRKLLAAGLVRAPGTNEPAEAPVFALGGAGTIDIHVERPEGAEVDWRTTVDVSFARAGVLVSQFPAPILARDVKVRITDDDATLMSGEFDGLSGGTADVRAHVVFREQRAHVVKPDVQITARDVPIDRLLLHALPGMDEAERAGSGRDEAGSGGGVSLGSVLRELHLSGELGAEVAVFPSGRDGAAPDEADYDVRVSLTGVRAAPSSDDAGVAGPSCILEDVSGAMHITGERIRIDPLRGRVVRTTGDEPTGPIDAARVSLSLDAALSEAPAAERGGLSATIDVADLDLAAPVEELVHPFSPGAAARLAAMRKERNPSGRIHANIGATTPGGAGPGAHTAVEIALTDARSVGFDALGGRLGLEWTTGVLRLWAPGDGPNRIGFENMQLFSTLDGRAGGSGVINGSFAVDGATGGIISPARLDAVLAGWRFESPILVRALDRVAGAATSERYRKLNPEGEFDASISLADSPTTIPGVSGPAVRAELTPRTLAFDYGGERAEFTEVSGKVTLQSWAGAGVKPVSGRVDRLRAVSPKWTATGDGRWSAVGGGESQSVQVDLSLGLEAQELDGPLRALLPSAAQQVLTAVNAEFRGPFALREGRVRTSMGEGPGATTFTGRIEATEVAVDAGVPVGETGLAVDLKVNDPGDGGLTTFDARATAEEIRVAGVRMADALVTVQSGASRGEFSIPEFTAGTHGGRVFATARLALPAGWESASAPEERTSGGLAYKVEMLGAGVRLAPVLAELAAAGVDTSGPAGVDGTLDEAAEGVRGSLDAFLSLEGVSGRPETRIGRGALRVANGDILRLPLVLPLVQISNLQLPWGGGRLGYMESRFYVEGDRVNFQNIVIASRSVEIRGYGILNIPDLTLDLRFNSRATDRLPMITDLFEALRDQFVSTRVTGSVMDPSVDVVPFSGARQALDAMFGSGGGGAGGGEEGGRGRAHPWRAAEELPRRPLGAQVPAIAPDGR